MKRRFGSCQTSICRVVRTSDASHIALKSSSVWIPADWFGFLSSLANDLYLEVCAIIHAFC
jgi:hypothetical protein